MFLKWKSMALSNCFLNVLFVVRSLSVSPALFLSPSEIKTRNALYFLLYSFFFLLQHSFCLCAFLFVHMSYIRHTHIHKSFRERERWSYGLVCRKSVLFSFLLLPVAPPKTARNTFAASFGHDRPILFLLSFVEEKEPCTFLPRFLTLTLSFAFSSSCFCLFYCFVLKKLWYVCPRNAMGERAQWAPS